MIKRILCVAISAFLMLTVLPFGLVATGAESANLSREAAIAYKQVIDETVGQYGLYKAIYGTYMGIVEASLIDFDGDGNLELLVGCGHDVSGDEYFYEVYSYNGNLQKLTHTYACNSMQLVHDMMVVKKENDVYVLTGVDGMCDSTSYYGTINGGRWEITETYEHDSWYCDANVCPNAGKDIYTINGRSVTQAEYVSFIDGMSYDMQVDGYVAGSGLDGINATIKTLDEAIDSQGKNTTELIKNAYVAKLQSILVDVQKNYESQAYYVYDIDVNGVPELIVKRGTCEADYRFDVYTYANDQVVYVAELPAGHIALYGLQEKGILLYVAHMGWEMIYEAIMSGNSIQYKKVFEDDCSQKAYNYDGAVEKYRFGATYLEKSNDLSDYTLLHRYFDMMEPAQGNIMVTVDGETVEFDQQPIAQDGRTLVPVRAIFEKLGATVNWDGKTQTVTATKGEITLTLALGMREMYKNGEMIWLDVAPCAVAGRILVPVRAIAEGFGCSVDWDADNRCVIIQSKSVSNVDCSKIMDYAKELCMINEAKGGAKVFDEQVQLNATIRESLQELDEALSFQETVLLIEGASLEICALIGQISQGNITGTAKEIADVLIQSGSDVVFAMIKETMPDMQSFIYNMGVTACEKQDKDIANIRLVHERILSGQYTEADAVSYIYLFYQQMINNENSTLAVALLQSELPDGFLESLKKSLETAAVTFMPSVVGDFIEVDLEIGSYAYLKIAEEYSKFSCGESNEFYAAMVGALKHPAVDEWARNVTEYSNAINTRLSTVQ